MGLVVFCNVRKEKVTYFCTQCWKEIDRDEVMCPHCGANQHLLSREPFVRKLIRALRHPEAETPVRAAYVLGELKAVDGVPDLIAAMTSTRDPYLAAACARALGEIGDFTALRTLEELLRRQAPFIVRRAAERSVEKLKEAQRGRA